MLRRPQQVRDPDGREWTVGILWFPRRPRWRGWGFGRRAFDGDRSEWWRGADAPDPEALLIIVGVLILTVLAWFFVFPVVFLLLDVLLVLVLGAGAIVPRVLFRRPWIVQAATAEQTRTWPVVGWRNSRACVDELVARLQRGAPLDGLPDKA